MIVIETQLLNPSKEKRVILSKELSKDTMELASFSKKQILIRALEDHYEELIKSIENMSQEDLEANLL